MEYKQAIIVRTDVKMEKGKLASQVAHASVSAAYKCWKKDKKIFEKWFPYMKKVVLKVGTKKELIELFEKAKREGVIAELIIDAGKTQIPPGTITTLCIGPDEEEKIDKIVGNLKLL